MSTTTGIANRTSTLFIPPMSLPSPPHSPSPSAPRMPPPSLPPPSSSPLAQSPLTVTLNSSLEVYMDFLTQIRSVDPRIAVDYVAARPPVTIQNNSLRAVEITEFSSMYGPQPLLRPGETRSSCPAFCIFRNAYKIVAETLNADVVFFNAREPLPSLERPLNQVWVGHYFESPEHHALLRSADHMSQLNFTMGFMPYDDFFQGEMIYHTFKHFNTTRHFVFPTFEQRQRHPMMSVWISNCNLEATGRMRISQQLQREGVTIASYGSCHRTHQPVLQTNDSQWTSFSRLGDGELLIAVSIRHLFFYAAENGKCSYYHTEKVFHALVAGSVPIYVGDCVSIKHFVPSYSVILASDFKNESSLAAYLLYLSKNETAYNAYLAWRQDWGNTRESRTSILATIMRFCKWVSDDGGEQMRCAMCEFFSRKLTRKVARPLGCLN